MNNLTKEQINLYTAIGAGLLILIFFAMPVLKMEFFVSKSITMADLLGKNFLLTILSLLAILCPIYLILDAFKDKEALKPLAPIFVIDRTLAGYIMGAVAAVFLIVVLTKPVGGSKEEREIASEVLSVQFGIWLYFIISACICYLGLLLKSIKK